jgi:SAM-dependent methyltransferase
VRAARERLAREGLAGRFLVADAECLPFRDRAMSVTWTSLLLHHFPKLDRLPRELGRITRDRLIAFETNAQNAVTWLAFNVVNRWWGISAMTRNQRALWPGALRRLFGRLGFRELRLHYVDRAWTDNLRGVRRLYARLTAWLPLRFRANKFLVIYEKSAP